MNQSNYYIRNFLNKKNEKIKSLNLMRLLSAQVGFARTTYERETTQPVIGFDMGGKLGFTTEQGF